MSRGLPSLTASSRGEVLTGVLVSRRRSILSHLTSRRWIWVVMALACCAFGAFVLVACGEDEEAADTTDEGTPKPGGVYNYALSANPVAIDARRHPGVRGLAGRAPGARRPGRLSAGRDRRHGGRPEDRRELGGQRGRHRLHLHAEAGRHVPAARQPRGRGAGLRRLVEPRHQPGQRLLHVVHPRPDRGRRRRRLLGRGRRPHRRQGDRRLHARGHAALLVRRVPEDPRPHRRLGRPRSSTSTRSAPRPTTASPSAPAPSWSRSGRTTSTSRLVRNPDYWDTENAAYLDEVYMPIILESSTQWLEFQKGTIDYTTVPPGQVQAVAGHARGRERRVDRQGVAHSSPRTSWAST